MKVIKKQGNFYSVFFFLFEIRERYDFKNHSLKKLISISSSALKIIAQIRYITMERISVIHFRL